MKPARRTATAAAGPVETVGNDRNAPTLVVSAHNLRLSSKTLRDNSWTKMNDDPPSPSRSRDLDIDITIQGGSWSDRLSDSENLVRHAVEAAWTQLPDGRRPDRSAELSIVLSDDATVRVLNRDYRGQDKPTNVLSFANLDDETAPDSPDASLLLGDVVLALETVLREAESQGKAAEAHLSHLVVHGLLHLLGYDHENNADAEEMEALERRILAGLGIADPYAEPATAGGAA